MPGKLEIALVAHNDRYDDDDPRWHAQTAALVHDLRAEAGSVRLDRTPVPGTKGAADQLILSLGSAGAFSVAVQLLGTWLKRDRHRSVELTFTDAAGNRRTVRASAENAGTDSLAPLIEAASELAREP
ncbi:effector-associated constant component EACC1 [Actinoplanes sp. CA-030573]|uniref:effector-associated constant component EACC1 n=1 Tax=Actinoplanes sp. CA-030573 TaxID=3239898 RepID=UPI003D91B32C